MFAVLIRYIFSYNPVFWKKDRTSSILTFSNNLVKLVILKNRFLMTAKPLHSIRMCLTMHVVWQVKRHGWGSCCSMKAWVSLVWPVRDQDIMTCSLLDVLKDGLYSSNVGWIWKSLLWMFMSHRCRHFLLAQTKVVLSIAI